jgi:hypothetical protein
MTDKPLLEKLNADIERAKADRERQEREIQQMKLDMIQLMKKEKSRLQEEIAYIKVKPDLKELRQAEIVIEEQLKAVCENCQVQATILSRDVFHPKVRVKINGFQYTFEWQQLPHNRVLETFETDEFIITGTRDELKIKLRQEISNHYEFFRTHFGNLPREPLVSHLIDLIDESIPPNEYLKE